MASRRRLTTKAKARDSAQKKKGAGADDLPFPSGYLEVLEDIKERVHGARIRASLSVNRELIILYWEIGRLVLERQEAEGWGAKVIDRLSVDLNYMRAFANTYPAQSIVQESLAQITSYPNIALLQKVKDPVQREELLEYGSTFTAIN
jgi:predicted AAA+ superfamily ATPase